MEALDAILVEKLLESVRPDLIVNCVGLLNDVAGQSELEAYRINGLLPHQLAEWAKREGGRLIHISTDCVFSGTKGNYEELCVPDGTSVYSRTKALGEVQMKPHLTIRTSIIGPEIRASGIGLFQWFMNQKGLVKGYVNVLWNGVTTLELSKFIHHAMEKESQLSGLVHLTAAEVISKYELLQLIQCIFEKWDVTILPDEAVVHNRTLNSTRSDLCYKARGYSKMLEELSDWMGTKP
ncbi:dTDP-4-dehydrorhamnose reductase [Paenibacillus popilliae ATCC 14706]|uniref:dTDP-4-dehydrorhamnose reductase n=2 Tax=Paenibacillus popilliae TaxID=78057 RepID=M9LD14_PAEPP|nr:dTDP-4-dehydrorhamnose reductase [Paenibacillus popilliae ATCC 14706]